MTIERPMFPPRDSSRRGFLTVAAGASVASAGALAVAAMPATAPGRPSCDAELIALGARFEPLLDKYYAVRRIWAEAMLMAHSERDQRFGPPADRDYRDTPEIKAAYAEICERNGLDDACARLSASFAEMTPLANAINAAPVTSIEGLRAKALAALWEVAPSCAGQTEFSFDDAWPFQQLFTAVTDLCGLKDKMAATGYVLPDIGIVEAAPDDDSDDEGEDA
jgi:hypothetical protein